ncbi:Glutamate-1-semialdehyde 2,1-aminomutase [Novipirellula aureliae]|uniref:Glutamate-1-semialdehyde 2,1-aminomutase n=2 Tax=Novipirellula aureliae TaxID=2527966 RepID=A0A5C6DBS1_9BACT|nr:Glutamate-1-semialdehyde 2,1-aminomutase [Novipirellula aureliae]
MRVLSYHLPLVAERGEGARVWDVDGKEYLDLNMAYGPLLFGHCPQRVIDSVVKQISTSGSQLGFPTEISARVASKIKQLYPGMELMRFANSGTESCAAAVRLARAYTGKNVLVMFEGHYHGWSDAVFNKYHAPLDALPEKGYGPIIPGTLGLAGAPNDVVVVRWNDIDALEACFREYGDRIAACIMEPVMGNSGVIPPADGYLQGVREMTLNHDSLLIFDEVITGFRVAAGGAQSRYMVQPDITVISKALGSGYPVGAFGASHEMMSMITEQKLFHGGVFSGNAVVMAAAEAAMDTILESRETMYPYMEGLATKLADGLREIFGRLKIPHLVQNVGPLLGLFLTDGKIEKVNEYRDVRKHCQFDKYIHFQHHMQNSGVYFHPNQFEPMFLSTAHTADDIDMALERFADAAAKTCCK